MPPTESRKRKRPTFHVWIAPEAGQEPEYAGTVAITNGDQLRAELEAAQHGLRDLKAVPFHLTNLWIWAACVRLGMTEHKFKPFTQVMEYEPDKETAEAEADPTSGATGPSIASDLPLPSIGGTPPTG